ncbi:hypothetical protein LCGC14_2417200 [marine sediment metagenome]|uniref:N-acetyltransferase domain-containing protein n=1 Tax=marine sediment metagenome TaxID=412755 RepID=A0A0F9BQU8_9ZZZZ
MSEYYEPKNLEDKLTKRGYQKYALTTALGLEIDKIPLTRTNSEVGFFFYDSRVEEFSHFLEKFSKRTKAKQIIINEITQRIIIPKKCFLVANLHEEIIGTLMGVLNSQGFLYIGDVLVHPQFRRQNIATSMLNKLVVDWGLSNKTKYVWLQIEKDNYKAQNLYQKLGMKIIYSYYYMKKSPSK